MYLNSIRLENIGPIKSINLSPKFTIQGHPHLIVIVGKNGAGKSIFTANIVNALCTAQNKVFEDSDVKRGKVYKFTG